jgi:hypothetical protein
MPTRGEMKIEKILVKNLLSKMWLRIPGYYRPDRRLS